MLDFKQANISKYVLPDSQLPRNAIFSDLQEMIGKLRLKGLIRGREFLMGLMNTHLATKPNTNLNIIQQSVLLKYAPLFHYIQKWSASYSPAPLNTSQKSPTGDIIGSSIKEHYVDVVAPSYVHYFSRYHTVLQSLVQKAPNINISAASYFISQQPNPLNSSPSSIQSASPLLETYLQVLDSDQVYITHVVLSVCY